MLSNRCRPLARSASDRAWRAPQTGSCPGPEAVSVPARRDPSRPGPRCQLGIALHIVFRVIRRLRVNSDRLLETIGNFSVFIDSRLVGLLTQEIPPQAICLGYSCPLRSCSVSAWPRRSAIRSSNTAGSDLSTADSIAFENISNRPTRLKLRAHTRGKVRLRCCKKDGWEGRT